VLALRVIILIFIPLITILSKDNREKISFYKKQNKGKSAKVEIAKVEIAKVEIAKVIIKIRTRVN
jgi:hypothetical protein